MEFTYALMRGPGALEIAERELIAAFVSGLNGCTYCFGAHGATAEAFGISAALLEALVRDIDRAEELIDASAPDATAGFPLDASHFALLRFVRMTALEARRISQGDVDRVLAAGWTEDALHDAIAIASRYAMVNRICMAHGIEVDGDELREAGRRMADPDWRGPPRR